MKDKKKGGITCETNKVKHKLGFLDSDLHMHAEACICRPNTYVRRIWLAYTCI